MAPAKPDDTSLIGEEAVIALLAPLAAGYPGAFGLQDDCALLTPPPGCDLVLKTDPIAGGVHFLPDDAPEDIAWKALAVNVSDLAAKGATPLGYLMALSFPEPPRQAWMAHFVNGLGAAQARFGCHLLGGDTDRRPGPITVSITVIGAVPRGKMVRRTTAEPGCALFVSGTIGDASLGLAVSRDPSLAAVWGLSEAEAAHLIGRYRRPEPRLALAPLLRTHAAAAMDLSDGLIKDLERMLKGSGLSGHLRAAAVPLSEPARKVIAREPDRLASLLTAGDDYEVLTAVPAPLRDALRSAAAATGIPLSEVGTVGPSAWPAEGTGLTVAAPDGAPMTFTRTGWVHF